MVRSIWLTITLSNVKNPFAKLVNLSILFLFLLVFVFTACDVSSFTAQSPRSVETKVKENACTTSLWAAIIDSSDIQTAEECIDSEEGILGRIEIGDSEDLKMTEVFSQGMLFHIASNDPDLLAQLNLEIRRIWKNKEIQQITRKYYSSINHFTYHNLVLRTVPLFIGISLLLVFTILICVSAVKEQFHEKTHKER